MKNLDWKKALPHLIAVGVFLIAALIIGKSGLEPGVVLRKGDTSSWEAMVHQSMLYKEAHGHFPLWVTSMFSGMPAYNIGIDGGFNPALYFSGLFQLWLPEPMNYFFLACISFYILTQCLRLRPWVGIFGSLTFAYCTFMPIAITAGHVTQVLAIAFAPAVIGGVILIFRGKYISGTIVTALFTSLQIAAGHQQVSYYLFIVLAFASVSYLIYLFKQGRTTAALKSLGLVALAGIIGVFVNAVTLFPTYDYAKASKRGGQLVMPGTKSSEKVQNGKTTGLSKEYAFQWSYGKAETMGLMFPGVMGYGFHYAERDGNNYLFPQLKEDSKTMEYLAELGVPAQNMEQLNFRLSKSLYWGAQPFTNGPVYLGAVACLLFILGMFKVDGKHKWWIFGATILSLLLAMGSNLPGFNYFLFDHLPLYNKFRVPTMALIIPQWLVPLMGALYLNKIIDEKIGWTDNNTEHTVSFKSQSDLASFKKGLIAVAAVLVLALGFYMSASFTNMDPARVTQFTSLVNAGDPETMTKIQALPGGTDNDSFEEFTAMMGKSPDAIKNSRGIINALSQDRKSLFLADILRTLLFVALSVGLIWFYLKNKIKENLFLIGITLLSFIDLFMMDVKYLNDKNYASKDAYETSEFPVSDADRAILKDPDPNFRVLNLARGLESSKPAYHYKTIGGYHAAKLGIYDDLMAHGFSNPDGSINMGVINMLNAKYIVAPQNNQEVVQANPGALGNAWFVKNIVWVNGPVAEMQSLAHFNPKDTAVIDNVYKSLLNGVQPADSAATIRQTAFDNDAISYESDNAVKSLAVFSEIFYKDWNAYIDGQKTDIVKVNYVLRGLAIPPGKHKIDFKFEPKIFFISKTISQVAGWIVFLMVIGGIVLFFRRKNKDHRDLLAG